MANNRASLLAGLRTGGVRSTTNPLPHTAAPNVTSFSHVEMPMSASFNGSFGMNSAQAQQVQLQAQQALQMQMMQLEIMRLQALQQAQQQQLQVELARQQQQQQQQQAAVNRRSFYNEPMSAAPAQASFMNRRSSQQAENPWQQQAAVPRSVSEEQVPMTASLGGKFGSRLNPNAAAFRMSGFPEEEEMIAIPRTSGNQGSVNAQAQVNHTTVISGGTPLGFPNAALVQTQGMPSSKSDTSLNWRNGANNSVLRGGTRTASVSVKITPPPEERISPPPIRNRPEPLRFSIIAEKPETPLVIIDSSDGETAEDLDDTSSSSAKSEPTTPPSASSVPLSPREAASKRLYEGLGIGRPVPHTAAIHTLSFPSNAIPVPNTSAAPAFPSKVAASAPLRQPRGPPAGVDELGPKNFASRIRRKAIGGLGAMLDARVNRKEVEAY